MHAFPGSIAYVLWFDCVSELQDMWSVRTMGSGEGIVPGLGRYCQLNGQVEKPRYQYSKKCE
jgi:hypothetical protein